MAQVLKEKKGGEAVLALSGDEDKLQAASQLIIGAAAIYDGSATSISASQVYFHTPCTCPAYSCLILLQFAYAGTTDLAMLLVNKEGQTAALGTGKIMDCACLAAM